MKIFENRNLKDLEKEIWKDIEEYNGDYQISNFGRVKSFKKYHGTDVRILRQHKNKNKRLFVKLYKNRKGKNEYIHILVFENFYRKLKSDECVHHLNKNPEDNIFSNLKEMNILDHNILHNLGKNNPNAILTEQDIIKIWKYLDEGNLTQTEISEIFEVNSRTISLIKNNKIWKHVKGERKIDE